MIDRTGYQARLLVPSGFEDGHVQWDWQPLSQPWKQRRFTWSLPGDLGEKVATAFAEAFAADTRRVRTQLREDFEHERARVDRLTDVVVDLARGRSQQ